jgi:hypothetical protein
MEFMIRSLRATTAAESDWQLATGHSQTEVSVTLNLTTGPPLNTGSLAEAMNSKTLRHQNLRRANPLIKPLIGGSVEQFH